MSGRVVAGIILLLVALGLFLDARGTIGFGAFAAAYWPLVLILIGAAIFVSRPRRPLAGGVLIGVGLLFLASRAGWLPRNWHAYLLPFAILVLALWLLGGGPRARRRGAHAEPRTHGWRGPITANVDADELRIRTYFSGTDQNIHSSAFRGGSVDVAFGGAKIDLRNAQLAATGARLDLNATFGGIELFVPSSWRVALDAHPFLGGVTNHGRPTGAADGPVLAVQASATFGGIEIKN